MVERLFSSSLTTKFISLSAPWRMKLCHFKHCFKSMLYLYHVTLLKGESVDSSHKFKKQEEINIFDFQRDVSSIGFHAVKYIL